LHSTNVLSISYIQSLNLSPLVWGKSIFAKFPDFLRCHPSWTKVTLPLHKLVVLRSTLAHHKMLLIENLMELCILDRLPSSWHLLIFNPLRR
jgi:hypothetical protein